MRMRCDVTSPLGISWCVFNKILKKKQKILPANGDEPDAQNLLRLFEISARAFEKIIFLRVHHPPTSAPGFSNLFLSLHPTEDCFATSTTFSSISLLFVIQSRRVAGPSKLTQSIFLPEFSLLIGLFNITSYRLSLLEFLTHFSVRLVTQPNEALANLLDNVVESVSNCVPVYQQLVEFYFSVAGFLFLYKQQGTNNLNSRLIVSCTQRPATPFSLCCVCSGWWNASQKRSRSGTASELSIQFSKAVKFSSFFSLIFKSLHSIGKES